MCRGSSATVFQDAHLWSKTTAQTWTGTSRTDGRQTWADLLGGKVCLLGQLQQECVRTFLRRHYQKTDVWRKLINSQGSSGCCPKICSFQINPVDASHVQELFRSWPYPKLWSPPHVIMILHPTASFGIAAAAADLGDAMQLLFKCTLQYLQSTLSDATRNWRRSILTHSDPQWDC